MRAEPQGQGVRLSGEGTGQSPHRQQCLCHVLKDQQDKQQRESRTGEGQESERTAWRLQSRGRFWPRETGF